MTYERWQSILEAITDQWDWVGVGVSVIHAVNRRDVREQSNRMTQSLCKVATLAYSLENQPRMPIKKLCGNCRNALARISPNEGLSDRSTWSNGHPGEGGLAQGDFLVYGSLIGPSTSSPATKELAPQHDRK